MISTSHFTKTQVDILFMLAQFISHVNLVGNPKRELEFELSTIVLHAFKQYEKVMVVYLNFQFFLR